ncbi:LysR family transcriptional regulator [Alteromonadaceae bacterium BrNp21-10]|nr:LysR family transcriptional regulator [Alteromonadaceae bacterium BrNp21-10]
MKIPPITLEQWATFKTVVDEGSFAKAAEVLNKSQSSVSYIISRLEAQLPTPALQQQGRKAELTDAGKQLYRHASNLLVQAQELENIAHYLASGWESQINIAIDAIVQRGPLFCALQQFSIESPQTRINILETTLSATDEAILFRQADIVLTPQIVTGHLGTPLGMSHLHYVCAASHPLAKLDRAISEEDLKQHRQIVIRDSGVKRQKDSGWLGAEQRWTFSHFSTSIQAIGAGLGFAALPIEIIKAEIESGELVTLQLSFDAQRQLPLYLVRTARETSGPATLDLAEKIVQAYQHPDREHKQ